MITIESSEKLKEYLIMIHTEKKLLIHSKKAEIKTTILFGNIISISLHTSPFDPMQITYKCKSQKNILQIIVSSIKDYLWIRSIFYEYKFPELLLTHTFKEMQKFETSVSLITFNMNRKDIQFN